MSILSIQSAVVYGHVGNSAAVFLLQRLGFEVWPLDTVSFSNHPGYPTVRGRVVPAAEVRALLAGIEERLEQLPGAFGRERVQANLAVVHLATPAVLILGSVAPRPRTSSRSPASEAPRSRPGRHGLHGRAARRRVP